MLARLSILSGKREGEVLELKPGTYQVGTGRSSDIQFRDKGVGFKHAKLTVGDSEVSLEDLKSKGGTFVGGEQVEGEVKLSPGELRLGTVELRIEFGVDSAAVQAPVETKPTAEPAKKKKKERPKTKRSKKKVKPEPAIAEPVAVAVPKPKPAAEAPTAPAGGDDLPDDTEILKQRLKTMQRELEEQRQVAKAYEQALEAQGSGGGDGADALGYAPSVADDLELRVLELQQSADEKAAALLEREEELKNLERSIERMKEGKDEALASALKEQEAMAKNVMRGHESVEQWKGKLESAQAEISQFEDANSALLIQNEEMKEGLESLEYRFEEERSKRGELVRGRIADLLKETRRLEASNVELRTLVEAYEEKIDELDERVEELEGENEEHQGMESDLRVELAKVKAERENVVKTLRKKLKSMETKVEVAEGESARARSQATSPRLQDQTTGAK